MFNRFSKILKPVSLTSLLSTNTLVHQTRSLKTHLKCCSETESFFSAGNTLNPFHVYSRNFRTDWLLKMELKRKAKLAFESADSLDKKLIAFKEMESCCDQKELGFACMKLAVIFHLEKGDPQMVLYFGKRCIQIFDDGSDTSTGAKLRFSLPIANLLCLLGETCFELKCFDESLSYLNSANVVLIALSGDSNDVDEGVLIGLRRYHGLMANVQRVLGMMDDCVFHLKKVLEIEERLLDACDLQIGKTNMGVVECYYVEMRLEEALPYCLKALEIHVANLGQDSVEVAEIRKLLGTIYSVLNEDEKAFEQIQLSLSVLKYVYPSSELIEEEIEAAIIQIALGRYDEAVDALKALAARAEKEKKGELRASAYISMARAFICQEKFADAKRCLEMASEIYEKKEGCCHEGWAYAMFAGKAFLDLSTQYEKMNELETSLSYLKKVFEITEKLPTRLLCNVAAKIYSLISLTPEPEKGVPYLEQAVQRLTHNFGPRHLEVGRVYLYLGAVYHGSGQLQTAAEYYAHAKDIFDVSLGPHHMSSVEVCQILFVLYVAMGSYSQAIDLQGEVVESLKDKRPIAQDLVDNAVKALEYLKEKASSEVSESLVKALPQSKAGEDCSAKEKK